MIHYIYQQGQDLRRTAPTEIPKLRIETMLQETTTTRRTTTVPTRTVQLREAHRLARALELETRQGHDRREYELILWALISRRSLRQATRTERIIVLKFLEEAVAEREAVKRPVYSAAELSRIVNADDLESLWA